ncbi:hypothetical protein FSARC_2832 [Fusarium sarcochroum]|uniref:LysM domain-containing protein n=1 Tax=Fusarium sarcochroum TaxID=1208366 RepID=A0A8H4U5N7_9HYPO|nr:hypothetical protein FSARC_2832 [Fusarium sarcochroum]
MGPSWVVRLSLLGLALVNSAVSDDCQASTWTKRSLDTDGINCRLSTVSASKVDSSTCASLAKKHGITVYDFYELNPGLKVDCKNVEPETRYCVEGFTEPLRALDGKCGPSNGNATCVGTDKQCCNKNSWTCGDTVNDCTVNCYEGNCY